MDNYSEFKLILESILDTAVDGIININDKGIIININQAALKLFEYEKHELIGQNIKLLMESNDRSQHDKYISNYLETKKPKIIGIGREVFGLKKTGKVFPFRLAVSEVILNDKIIFTGIIHDLTALNKAMFDLESINMDLDKKVVERTYQVEKVVNQLLSTNTQLQKEIKERESVEQILLKKEVDLINALAAERELNELKSRFVSTVSHEFRTPLSTILSSAALIKMYPQSEQQNDREKHIDKIKNSVNHLTGMLNDLLSLSKLEEGKINMNVQDINLNDVLKSTIEELSPILKKDQKILLDIEEKYDVTNDKSIIKNILFNIMSNAIKYSDNDVYVKVFGEGDVIKIKIKDKGIGIPTDDQKYLFDRFFRAANVGNIQGTGLGLNIVKRYCQLINADISIESKLNEGTEVSITLIKNDNQ